MVHMILYILLGIMVIFRKDLRLMNSPSNIPDDIQEMFRKYGNETANIQEEGQNPQSTISSLFQSFGKENEANHSSTDSSANPFGNIDMATLMKMKGVMDKMNSNQDNPRSNLLRSLKPYLKPSRKEKVEQYIGLLNMEQVIEGLGILGGDKKK